MPGMLKESKLKKAVTWNKKEDEKRSSSLHQNSAFTFLVIITINNDSFNVK